MLSMKPLKSAKDAHDYYMKAIEYYQSDSTATCWLGSGKSHLNLDGPVDSKIFLNLLEGKLPNGQTLQNPNGEHRPGFDMTFSAPKSVSLLTGLGVAPELIKMHDAAVQHAISQIEKEFAQTRIIKNGEVFYKNTGNLLIASFRQPSSRANDPALHTHCVALNMTFFEGRARSLASDKSRTFGVVEQIQNHERYCGLLYRQHLANSLKEAGFQLRLKGNGLFEIAGIPEEVLTEFSKRREDIERIMEERGWTGAKSAAVASEITRNQKEEHDLKKLQEDWESRAREMKFDARAFIENRGHDTPQHNDWLSTIKNKLSSLVQRFRQEHQFQEESVAKACVTVGIETLSQRTSVFTERALFTEALKHSLAYEKSVAPDRIRDVIHQAKKENDLYVSQCPKTREIYLTTPWLLTLEAETIARIDANKNAVESIATAQEIKMFHQRQGRQSENPMTASQRQAQHTILTTKDRYLAIQGYAGTAKTTMLKETKILIEEKGYQLRGIAVASTAANELQTKGGIRSDVFPVVYQELKAAKNLSLHKTIFIVDEASLLSSPQGHELLKHIERTDSRLVLVGDKAQLPSVNNGRLFGLIQEYGIETSVMDDIVRQKNISLKEAVISATTGDVKAAIDKLDIQELSSHDERIQWIANRWIELNPDERDKTLLFAPTHADRAAITKIIREGLHQEGTLRGVPTPHSTLIAKPMEAVHQRFIAYYQKGDVIRFNQDFVRFGIERNQYYTVGTILPKHRKDNVVPIINTQGKSTCFALKALPTYKTHTAPFERVLEIYTEKNLSIQAGEKLMWTRNFKEKGIRNGDAFTITSIQDNCITIKTKEDTLIPIDKDHPALKHFDYGYVLTNYKVQGKDAPYGIGLMESYHRFGATMKNFYVQISRAIHGMTLVTDDKEQLTAALIKNKDEKEAALDRISSQQLKDHAARFKEQSNLSLQPVIDRKMLFENARPHMETQRNSKTLDFIKQQPPKTQELVKELER